MLITFSVSDVPIRLTTERWQHVCEHHLEVRRQQHRVLQTIREPAEVFQGDFGIKLASRFYRRTPLTSKHLIVAYRETGTTDFARRLPTWRQTLWKR